jgi:serine/threonine protein kinase
MGLTPGTKLGPYEIISPLGAGGMGEVHRARDSRLDRTVAIKVMRSGVAADEYHRKRFLREARATAALSHPGIAVLYDAGESGECLYLAMEYVEGHTLQQEIGNGPISSSTLRNYSLQIAAALEHAHARGIIHRDVKSANIMVTGSGVLKLLDFGLAQNTQPTEETATIVTVAGAFIGTLHYCAPEVLAGRTATVRSDIYSLGVVMYEMACGRVPFAGLNAPSLISAALRGQIPPVRHRNPAIHEQLANVIEQAMALGPQYRFQSAAELAANLRTMVGRPDKSAIFIERAAPVIAVLDFENLSGDSATDWLGTGISETISADLRKLETAQVVSRDRVQVELRSAGDSKDMAALGTRLKVRWLVTGSYQRSGDRIRITPKLLEPVTGEVTIIGKVDGAWDEIFDLQDAVVREIIQALELEMDSSARKRIAAPETLQLEAYEQYAEGMKKLQLLGKDSLESARGHFERAIDLDADYAVAYSALGQTYAMRWIHRNDPDDLSRASGCLERALELDSEMGEPYGTLCYVYLRQNKLEKAIDAGLKAVRRNPDAYLAHYYLAAASWAAGTEISDSYLQQAIEHFLTSIQIEPLLSPSWLNLGTIAMHTSAYGRAEKLVAEVLELQRAARGIGPLPFAEMILAGIWMRRLDWEKALEWHERGLKHLTQIDHVYRETAIALNACGMAEVHLRQNEPDRALADLHRAWRVAGEFPRMMAHNRVLARTAAEMASAYAALGERGRAEQFVNDAASRLETVYRNRGGFIHGVGTFELCHALAVAHIRLSDPDSACALLAKAVEKGGRDWRWLESDPELAPVRERIGPLIEQVQRLPALRFGAGAKAA